MEVLIIATKGCGHCANLGKELDALGVEYTRVFAEDEPELVQKYSIRHSPNLIVDGDVVCRHMPSEAEIRKYLNC